MNVTITKEQIQLSPGADILLRKQSWAEGVSVVVRGFERAIAPLNLSKANQKQESD
ncbi:MAG: hypothetical protein AAF716_21095 [Cyanobacteria bacterium P01_D01_bin.1]